MNGAPSDEAARLDALAYRFVGSLLLLGSGVFFGLLIGLLQLPRRADPGDTTFTIPGTGGHHGISAGVVPLLGGIAAVLAVAGLAAVGLGWSRRPLPFRGEGSRRALIPHRPAFVLLGGLTLLVIALALRR